MVIVGSGWTTPTGYPRAFVVFGTPEGTFDSMLNLNDPHLTFGLATTLVTAEHVNDQGWIVGNGTSYAFVLRRQPVVTP